MKIQRESCLRGDGCLNSQGYEVKRVGKRLLYVHRMVWIAAHGPIPVGYEVHHGCENKWCINLKHLELLKKLKHNQLHAPKLTMADVNRIRARCSNGETQAAIALEYGVSQSHVSRLVRGHKWPA